MISSLETRVQAITSTTLAPIALQSLQRSAGTLVAWRAEPIRLSSVGGGLGASAVYRVAGIVQAEEEYLPWSLIQKVITAAVIGTEDHLPTCTDHPREVAFYQSGLPRRLPAAFRAATCYHLAEDTSARGFSHRAT